MKKSIDKDNKLLERDICEKYLENKEKYDVKL